MALARFKDLCIDAIDPHAQATAWAPILGLEAELFHDDGDAVLRGPGPENTIWFNKVPESKTVKNRVHLDVRALSLESFAGLETVPVGPDDGWATFLDGEGNEFCVFTYDEVPDQRFKDLVVDAVDHERIAAWWHQVFGGELVHQPDHGYSNVDGIAGWPYESFDFGIVPEPKTVKNRIHWDITLEPGVAPSDLVSLGATILREPDDDIRWTVMADPEGNEFCAFV